MAPLTTACKWQDARHYYTLQQTQGISSSRTADIQSHPGMALGQKIWLFAVPGVLSQQSTKTVLFFHISEDTWIKYIIIKFPSLILRHTLLEQKKKLPTRLQTIIRSYVKHYIEITNTPMLVFNHVFNSFCTAPSDIFSNSSYTA